jgi:hypothetical protein
MTAQLESANRRLAEIEGELENNVTGAATASNELQAAQERLAVLHAERTGRIQPPEYRWDDTSPIMRVPKALAKVLPPAVAQWSNEVRVEETVKEFLQMSEAEGRQIEAALQRFLDGYEAILRQKVQPIEPGEQERRDFGEKEVRVFEVASMTNEVSELRHVLFSDLETTLGAERFGFFRSRLQDWMPIKEGYFGMNSSRVVVDFGHRRGFQKPVAGSGWIYTSINLNRNGDSMSFSMPFNEIPNAFNVYLQDWITLATPQPAATNR